MTTTKTDNKTYLAGSIDPGTGEFLEMEHAKWREHKRVKGMFRVKFLSNQLFIVESRAGDNFYMKFNSTGWPDYLAATLNKIASQLTDNTTFVLMDAKLKMPSAKRRNYWNNFQTYRVLAGGCRHTAYKLLTSDVSLEFVNSLEIVE